MKKRTHMIYLLGGNSKRFSGNKLNYALKGKPLYRYGLEVLKRVREEQDSATLTVVTQYQNIYEEIEEEGIDVIYSPKSKEGLSWSIQAGLEGIGKIGSEDGILFVVGDQPLLSQTTIEKFLNYPLQKNGIIMASWKERRGNPVLFSATLVPRLFRLKGEEGGRRLIQEMGCQTLCVEEEEELWDIDRRDEVENILEKLMSN